MGKILVNYDNKNKYYEYDGKSFKLLDNVSDLTIDGYCLNNGESFIGFFAHEGQLYLVNNQKIVLATADNTRCFNNKVSTGIYNLEIYNNQVKFIDINYEYYYDLYLDSDLDLSFGDFVEQCFSSKEEVDFMLEHLEKKKLRVKL